MRRFLRTLKSKKAAEVFASLQVNYQIKVLETLEPEISAQILTLMDPDETVDVLLAIPENKRQLILALLHEDKQKELLELLKLSSTPVGNLMTTDFIYVHSNLTVKDTFAVIKKDAIDFSFLSCIYIVNDSDHLVGVLSLHELTMQNLDTSLYKCMVQNPITIQLTTPVDIVVKKLLRYRLSALPVTDNKKKILGIVTIDDVSDIILTKFS